MRNVKEMTKNEIRADMIRNIKAHNKYFTDEYLNELNDRQLLCEVHPIYKEDYENMFKHVAK